MENQNKQEIKSHSLTSEFIPYQQALALKELGFNEKCIAADYDANGNVLIEYFNDGITNTELDRLTAECNEDAVENEEDPIKHDPTIPLYQQAFRWFREKHNLHNGIIPYYDYYYYLIKDFVADKEYQNENNQCSYEEAEQACLNKLIEIVKDGKTNKTNR